MGATRRPARSFPLRTLLLWLVVVLVVPTLVLAALTVRRTQADSRATAERRVIEEARELIRTVDDDLDSTIHALRGLSGAPSLVAGDLDGFRNEVTRHLPSHPSWLLARLATPDGHHLLDVPMGDGPAFEDPIEPDSIREAVTTRQPVVGSLRRGPGGRFAFAVRVPVIHGEAVQYVLSAVITPERLADVLPTRSGDDWLRVVLDDQDQIVFRSRASAEFVGQSASEAFAGQTRGRAEAMFESVTLDGEVVYSGVSRGATTGWMAVVGVPRAVIDADSRRTMALLGTVGILLLGLGVLISFRIARWIARDMSMVTDAASDLAAGRPVEVGEPRVEEVRQLSDALQHSAGLLRTREAERDARVVQADAARSQAETAMQAKDDFLAMLGHELRNPLAPVLNALHVAEASGGVLADQERRIVERQVRHMARLVDDLLDMSRLHRGVMDLHLEDCDLRSIVSDALEMTRALYQGQNRSLSVDVPDNVRLACDINRITQVIANLLGNAAKYTPAGGNVHFSVCTEGDMVVLVCQDDGIGLTPDLLSRVFDPFVQGPRRIDRQEGGLGLGLAVSRSLVEHHGGTIVVTSDGEGLGSRFEVRLPVGSLQVSVVAPERTEARAPVATRVLVVEDNHDVREMLVLALSMSGVEAEGVATAQAAIEAVASWRPTVAVLDVGLPDMDGFQLARVLRQSQDKADLLLLALTGYGGEGYSAEAREAGFDAYLVKPVDIDALLEAMARLRGGESEDTSRAQ